MEFENGSFRDRTNRVVISKNKIFRVLNHKAKEEWDNLKEKSFFLSNLKSGNIVNTKNSNINHLDLDSFEKQHWLYLIEHEKIPFISYPYEWCFGMLKDAALLQLSLIKQALNEKMILKDASPYNTQWKGSSPVFIDIASFVKLPPGTPWVGYRQFCELFLFPLMLQAYKNVTFHYMLRGNLEGISVNEMNGLFSSFRDKFRNGVFMHVFLQNILQKKFENQNKNITMALKDAGFSEELIKLNIRKIERLVKKLNWKQKKTAWSDYTKEHNYSDKDMDAKKEFVEKAISVSQRKLVWDLGCNTGTFSKIAEKYSDYVIAIDSDHYTVEKLYQKLKKENNNKILPLVINLADSSPGIGWRNMERKELLQRGRPDFIISLALIHHLVISSNIPMKECIKWFYDIGSELLIEFVGRHDSMVEKLLLNKDDECLDYSHEVFEQALSDYFNISDKCMLPSKNRFIYYAKPKK